MQKFIGRIETQDNPTPNAVFNHLYFLYFCTIKDYFDLFSHCESAEIKLRFPALISSVYVFTALKYYID